MTEPITITAAQAPEPIGPNSDIWEITTKLEVAVSDDAVWIQQGFRNVALDSREKALKVAASIVAAVELWDEVRAEGRAA
jgi:hypothetical protein